MSDEEIKKLIKDTLVEPAGALDRELVLACKGLITMDDVNKRVTVQNVRGLSDKDRILLFALGMRILSTFTGDISLLEIKPEQLLGVCMANATNKINVYFGRLLKDSPSPLRRGKRGSYEVMLPAAKEYLSKLKARLKIT